MQIRTTVIPDCWHKLPKPSRCFRPRWTAIGAANKVTLFTASDFGRALVQNGDGTDHGWGSHHFVVGGAVNGKNVYGAFPDLASNATTNAGNGRLIPTTSVEQYAATMAKWMGVSSDDQLAVDSAEPGELLAARPRVHDLAPHVGKRRAGMLTAPHRLTLGVRR